MTGTGPELRPVANSSRAAMQYFQYAAGVKIRM
jgi:cytochrome c2